MARFMEKSPRKVTYFVCLEVSGSVLLELKDRSG